MVSSSANRALIQRLWLTEDICEKPYGTIHLRTLRHSGTPAVGVQTLCKGAVGLVLGFKVSGAVDFSRGDAWERKPLPTPRHTPHTRVTVRAGHFWGRRLLGLL